MEQMGQQLGHTLPQVMQQRGQREMGLNAIDQLQAGLQQSGGDINKILPLLAKAYTLNPNLERSGLGQQFMQQAQRQQGSKEFPVGGAGMPMQAKPGEQKQIPVSVSDLVPARESMVQNPQGIPDFQLPYGPEEIANIRQQSRARGYLPEMEERFVNDALEYNKIAENRRNAELNNYQQQQRQREDTIKNQQLFEKYITDHDPEFSKNPDELELALKVSEKYQNEPSFAERNAKVKEELRPYQAAKKALEKGLQRPLFGYTKEQLKLIQPGAQYMVEMGQKPQLQAMIAKGGQGEVEEALLLNPLPENIDKRLGSLPKFVDPFEMVTVTQENPNYTKQLQKGAQARLNQRQNAVEQLTNVIEPGVDYNHPGTNLLLVRKHLMDKKATWEEAGQLIEDAIKTGEIELDPQQQIDYQRLSYPPLTGDSYSDTVMNNIMFPITGRQ
jgi:hypothetical protein